MDRIRQFQPLVIKFIALVPRDDFLHFSGGSHKSLSLSAFQRFLYCGLSSDHRGARSEAWRPTTSSRRTCSSTSSAPWTTPTCAPVPPVAAARRRTANPSRGRPRAGRLAEGGLRREVYDAEHETNLPGTLVRAEGEDPVAGPDREPGVRRDRRDLDDVQRVLRPRLDRRRRARADARRCTTTAGYANAFWDGAQMVFGDGDGEIFGDFTGRSTSPATSSPTASRSTPRTSPTKASPAR